MLLVSISSGDQGQAAGNGAWEPGDENVSSTLMMSPACASEHGGHKKKVGPAKESRHAHD